MSHGTREILLSSIIVPERIRTEDEAHAKYIDEILLPSINEHGLIQPIVLEDDGLTLRCGRSRMLACQKLGYVTISYTTYSSLSDSDKLVVEFEENEVRQPMPWRDRVLALRKIYYKKKAEQQSLGERWGFRQAGLLLKTAFGHIRDIVSVGDLLISGNEYIASSANLSEAIKRSYEVVENRLHAELAARTGVVAGSTPPAPLQSLERTSSLLARPKTQIGPSFAFSLDDPLFALSGSATEQLNHPLPAPESVPRMQVPLNERIHFGDCLEILWNTQPACYDAIVTDPPYGNDLEEVEGIDGIANVTEHGTEWNDPEMMRKFFKLAYKVLKDDSWMFVFYDIRHQEKLCNWAEEAGFKVQGYPLHWIKLHPCRNQAPQSKWTKAVEYVLVARKGNPTKNTLAYAPNYFQCEGLTEKRAQANPYAKPYEFCEWFIKPWLIRGMEVLDPFMGGGSILRHIIRLGGVPHGIDIDPKNFIRSVEGLDEIYKQLTAGKVDIIKPDMTKALSLLPA